MNLVIKGSPTFINCKICGKIYLPDVAIKNNKPRTIIVNIIALYLFLLILMLPLDLDLSISKITTIIIITITNLIIQYPLCFKYFLYISHKNIDI